MWNQRCLIVSPSRVEPGLPVTESLQYQRCRVVVPRGGAVTPDEADLWLDYRAEREWPKKVKEYTNGRGTNFIVDGNQGPDTLKNQEALAPLSQVIFIGGMNGPVLEVKIPQLIVGYCGIRGFVAPHGLAVTQGADDTPVKNLLLLTGPRGPCCGPR